MLKLFYAFAFFVHVSIPASAVELTRCGNLNAYMIEQTTSGWSKSGWENPNVRLVLLRSPSGRFDIQQAEGSDSLESIRDDGATIELVHAENRLMAFLVRTPEGITLNFVFSENPSGRSTLIISGAGREDGKTSGSLAYASCSKTQYVQN